MKHFEWYDYIRVLTCALSVASLYRLAVRARSLWSTYTPYLKDLWWVLVAFLIVNAEGALEGIARDYNFAGRTLLGLIISAVAFRATLRKNPKYLNTE